MKRVDSKEIRRILEKFYELTESQRQGRPVHVPFTKYNGYSFLQILMELFGITKEEVIKVLDKAVGEGRIFRAITKGGVLYFLQPRERSKERKKDVDLSVFFG
jgi:hypothetical protein